MWDFIIILVGSCLAQVCFKNKKIEDKLVSFYKKFHPDANESVLTKVEYSILPIIGALIAYKLHSPEDWMTQIAVGFSWSAAFEALLNKT